MFSSYALFLVIFQLSDVKIPCGALMISCHREQKFVKISQGMVFMFSITLPRLTEMFF